MKNYRHYITLWLAVALFYCYQYILRASPNVMHEAIHVDFAINAKQFATLGSLYLVGYALMQIPLGILIDRFGVRNITLYSIALTSFAALFSGCVNEFIYIQIARLLIGIGSGSAFLCAIKIVSDYFPPGHRGFLIGTTLTIGTIGAMCSGYFISRLLAYYHWQIVLLMTGGLGIVILIINTFVFASLAQNSVQNSVNHEKEKKWIGLLISVKKIITHKDIMVYSMLAVGLYSPIAAISDLWGSAFISVKYGITQAQAADCIIYIFLGMALGSLVIPYFFEHHNMIDEGIAVCTLLLTIVFAWLIYGPALGSTLNLKMMLILLGFLCGAEMLCFTGVVCYSTPNNSGEVLGVVNTMNMLGGGIIQYIIGMILDYCWDGTLMSGIRYYNLSEFMIAMSIILLIMVCCVALVLYHICSNPTN